MAVMTTPEQDRNRKFERQLRSGPGATRCRRIVFARDKACCWCGRTIDFSIKWPHPRSASLEHLVPIMRLRGMSVAAARAIANDPNRCAVACLRCNTSRAAKRRNGTDTDTATPIEPQRVSSRNW
jgi:hypothetical protein